MEMSQIRIVLAATMQLNFTRAAVERIATRPALTKGIKAFGEELGVQGCCREGRPGCFPRISGFLPRCRSGGA